MSKPTECPICNGQYNKVHLSHLVCTRCLNAGWIVTVCPDCGKSRFSMTKGVCSKCLEKSPKIKGHGFNKNRRFGLISRGLGCKDNG